ncbi:amidase signature domain-containing protein [Phaeosphaeriaceae sp. PMI808]|nr:amidase signature domain-containing protein [Phaeosphaeriaceae sp. PMI808]
MAESWQEKALAKREGELKKIPEEWRLSKSVLEDSKKRRVLAGAYIESLLDKETLRITSLDPVELVECTTNGSMTAYAVVNAFSKRAAYGHQMSLNLLEVGFMVALDRAREFDLYYKTNGRPFGPLHGLPITLKYHWHVKDMETTFAYVGWIGTFEGEKGTGRERVFESELIQELVSLGAVVIGKSSLAVTTWAPESNNNIVGYQLNPWNQLLSAGGSSGGEGSVQALRGSAIGFGSDSSGSVGMPAAFNGVFSLKPSSGRLSFKDAPRSAKANLVIPNVVGILGPSIAALKLMFKSLQSTEAWKRDPYVLPLGYREDLEYSPHRDHKPAFGIMKDDGLVRPHPPIARALQIVEKALHQAGINTVPWNPPSHGETIDIHGPIARGDGCPDAYKNLQLSGESIVPQIAHLFPDNKLRPPLGLIQWEDVVLYLQDYRTRYKAYWESTSNITAERKLVSAYILPIAPTAAVIPGKFYHSPYSSSVNVLDYCSVVVQVTTASKGIDVSRKEYKPLSEKDKMNMDAYDAEVYDGAPAAIQIVGKQHDEEHLLSLAQLVVGALEKYKGEKIH